MIYTSWFWAAGYGIACTIAGACWGYLIAAFVRAGSRRERPASFNSVGKRECTADGVAQQGE